VAQHFKAAEGYAEIPNLEGITISVMFSRSTATGWITVVGIPKAEFVADIRYWLRWAVCGILLASLIGMGLASLLARRIRLSIEALIAPALALGNGEPVTLGQLDLQETNNVGQALVKASQRLQQHNRERERAEAISLQAEGELRESRAKLDTALASMTDAVFISDAKLCLLDFNEAFVAFYRFKSKAECPKSLAEYQSLFDVFTAEEQIAPLDMWAVSRALRGETVKDAEYTLRRKDTGETWIGSYSFAPIRSKEGGIVGAVVVGRDITERRRAEKQSERLKSALLDTVTHDLRTPLTSIKAVATGLRDLRAASQPCSATTEDQMLSIIVQQSDRLDRFIQGMIALAKIESNQTQPAATTRVAAMEDVIAAALSRAEDQLRSHAVNIDCEGGLRITVNPHAIAQVLFSLLENAARYSPVGSTITVAAQRKTSDVIQVSVEDEGPGVPLHLRQRIFDKFFRYDPKQQESESPLGLGLGLAIARGILEPQGGRIWVEDRPAGQSGARFVFTIASHNGAESNDMHLAEGA